MCLCAMFCIFVIKNAFFSDTPCVHLQVSYVVLWIEQEAGIQFAV